MVWVGRFVPKCEMRKEALKRPYDPPIGTTKTWIGARKSQMYI